ncbi:MAG TPA: hypothetical protein GXX48_01020 [Ochrobactrum intermedium]|uniref:Uncharacterized protein n=1 Tax=Brucella intermedia TaxID=94625 RepID=A0A7V6TY24_9HYPH|nr:hypothetical protein [Brucella intermedia]HHV66217.1 hypothetical protein [Brucella intermedia]
MAATPPRPPLEGLRRQLEKSRAQISAKQSRKSRMPRDGFVRETFTLPRLAAREKAREWFETFPKAAYWTEIESWCERPDDVIEFTMRRLATAD